VVCTNVRKFGSRLANLQLQVLHDSAQAPGEYLLLRGDMSSRMTNAWPPSSRTLSPAAAAAIMVASFVPSGASGAA
jgi:hypothetical protein